MEIISNNYNLVLKNLIFKSLNDNLMMKFEKMSDDPNVFNYINLISTLDDSLCKLGQELLQTAFEAIDKGFLTSKNRKRDYHVKAHHKRSIMTIFGEITYNRTYYIHKRTSQCYCYLDRYLGINKHDYFDPYVKAAIVDYAANNSFSKTALFISDLIGNRIKLDKSNPIILRQTVRNIVLQAKTSTPELKQLPTPENLYIMADEKWIHTQGNNKKDVMTKSIVIFDGIDLSNNKRPKLLNKQIFADYDNTTVSKVLDYIYYVYDVDKIKNVFLMGDGASWIKNLKTEFYFNNNIKVIQALDKFHFKQSLHHITLDDTLSNILLSYIIGNDRKTFKEVCYYLVKNNPHRENTINDKRQYILNNWTNIQLAYKHNLKCSMEAHISHNLADLFTSRPKAYSLKMLGKLLKIRLLYKNGHNIKKLYLNNYNSKEILTVNSDNINYSIFNPIYKQDTYPLSFNFKGSTLL